MHFWDTKNAGIFACDASIIHFERKVFIVILAILSKMPETITVPKDKYESMKETLDIMSDPKLIADIREGINDIRKGKTISLDKYLKK